MYQKGEYIMYGSTGVCRVEDVAVPDNIPIKEKGALYYRLAPVYGAGSIYIPVDTKMFMRPVLTKAQANELIDKIPNIKEQVYEAKDQKNLAGCYRASLRAHEPRSSPRPCASACSCWRICSGSGSTPR